MTLLFVPVIELRNSKINAMAKVEVDILTDNSLDNSADGECLMGMVEAEAYEHPGRSHDLPDPILDENEDVNTEYCFRDLSGAVTYKIVQMDDIQHTHSPTNGPLYVISNPDVFSGSATQKKAQRKEAIPRITKAISAKKRDAKRRATHNEVERRRRDKINSWITTLAALVPDCGIPDNASKGGILSKACDYITELTEKTKKVDKLEQENERLASLVLRLNQELTELRRENSTMRTQLADNNLLDRHKAHKS